MRDAALLVQDFDPEVHHVGNFCCGVDYLDDWLKDRSDEPKSMNPALRVKVDGTAVVGFYLMQNHDLTKKYAPAELTSGWSAPSNIPSTTISLFAIDETLQKGGHGRDMMVNALVRALRQSKMIVSKAVDLHSFDDDSTAFYEKMGFKQLGPKFRANDMYRSMNDIEQSLGHLL